jgi:photosystem II protein PsbQ
MIMSRYRSILASILALITVFIVSCGGPTAAKPPLYSATELQLINKYVDKVSDLRGRMDELAGYIETRDWVNVGSIIHGPFGMLRQDMSYLSKYVSPNNQPAAREAAKEVFGHLEKINLAAQEGDYTEAIRNYAEAIKDFDAFLQLIPNT